jgi:hypothetical protein
VSVLVVCACCDAHERHAASSVWNCSNDLPAPGSTITAGPVGALAHAPKNSAITGVSFLTVKLSLWAPVGRPHGRGSCLARCLHLESALAYTRRDLSRKPERRVAEEQETPSDA